MDDVSKTGRLKRDQHPNRVIERKRNRGQETEKSERPIRQRDRKGRKEKKKTRKRSDESERAVRAVRKEKMIKEKGYGTGSELREQVRRYWKE